MKSRCTFFRIIPLILLATAIAVAQQRYRPADPLDASERERAVNLAREEALRQKQLQPEKFSLVGVELVGFKDSTVKNEPAPETSPRHASVLFYRSDRNDGLQVLVDLAAGRARDLVTLRGPSVPIGREEVERAAAIALQDAGVKTLLGDAVSSFRVGIAQSDQENTIEGLRVLGAGPNDPCSRQRCVDLFFRQNGGYIVGSRVTVNLSTSTVRVTNTNR
jgi:hypothetical protein